MYYGYVSRLVVIIFLPLLFSCGGGAGSSRPGEGQFVMVHRTDDYGLHDLYQVRENGGGLLKIEANAWYHGFSSSSGRIVYTRKQSDAYVYQVCDAWPICHDYNGVVQHSVLYTANSDGSNPVAFESYPDNQYIDYVSSPVVLQHGFIALTANERVVYSRNSEVWSTHVNGSGTIVLPFSGSETIESVNDSGRLIYSSSFSPGSLYSIMDDGTGQVTLVDSTNNERTLYHNRAGEIFYSLDNNGQLDIHRVMEDGSSPTTVASAVCLSGDGCTLTVLGISPGDRLVFGRTYIDASLVLQKEIYAVKTDASEAPQLLCDTVSSGFCKFQSITPNGRVLVSTEDPASPGSGNVYSYNEDGSDKASPVLISALSTADVLKGFTPSGRIMFERFEGYGPGSKPYYDLYTIDDLGKSELPLMVTGGEDDRFAGISRSGKIIIQRTDNIVKKLYIANEVGSGAMLLATVDFGGQDGVNVANASTINGRVIYVSRIFTSPTTFQTDLHSVREDGADDVILASSPYSESFAGMF
ncbi:MAG: hypothetical protein P8047_14630 [Gammaproteobacteria bacterium]